MQYVNQTTNPLRFLQLVIGDKLAFLDKDKFKREFQRIRTVLEVARQMSPDGHNFTKEYIVSLKSSLRLYSQFLERLSAELHKAGVEEELPPNYLFELLEFHEELGEEYDEPTAKFRSIYHNYIESAYNTQARIERDMEMQTYMHVFTYLYRNPGIDPSYVEKAIEEKREPTLFKVKKYWEETDGNRPQLAPRNKIRIDKITNADVDKHIEKVSREYFGESKTRISHQFQPVQLRITDPEILEAIRLCDEKIAKG